VRLPQLVCRAARADEAAGGTSTAIAPNEVQIYLPRGGLRNIRRVPGRYITSRWTGHVLGGGRASSGAFWYGVDSAERRVGPFLTNIHDCAHSARASSVTHYIVTGQNRGTFVRRLAGGKPQGASQ